MSRYSQDSYENGGERIVENPYAKTKVRRVEYQRGPIDMPFFLLTLIILIIGVIMVLSASFARAYYASGTPTRYFTRQMLFAISGVALLYAASLFPVSFYRRMAMPSLYVSIFLLALVLVIGSSGGGAKRWINLGFTTFQPSEVAKISVVLSFAHMICVFKDKMKTFKYGVLYFGIILAIIVGLLCLEPHISASLIIVAVGAIMMFLGGTNPKWFILGLVILVVLAFILFNTMGYVSGRITSWLDPFSDSTGDGWQIIQSLYAIGSGGLTGLGLGQGRQKYLYLPEEHNDFIFSVYCEELGFVGAVLLLLLFAMLICRGYWLSIHCRNRFGSLVIAGLTSLLAIQVVLNVAVVTNLVPCTGISLPFFSYGGTALWIQLVEMGVILSISRDIPLKRSKKKDGVEEK